MAHFTDVLQYKPMTQTNRAADMTKIMSVPLLVDDWVFDPKRYGLVGIITQNDVDGLTSAESYSNFHGLPIVGLFDYDRLMMLDGYENVDPKQCVWIDCDIVADGYHSIGNHTTLFSNRDQPNENNCNLSNFYSIHGQNGEFTWHYTGSTLLMLFAMGMTNVKTDDGRRLVLFADGTFNNLAAFSGSKVMEWFDKLKITDKVSDIMPLDVSDVRLNDFKELAQRIGYRRAMGSNKPFYVDYEGHIICEYNLPEIMTLLGIDRPSQFVNRTATIVMEFNTGRVSTEIMTYHDRKHFANSKQYGELFAVSFIKKDVFVFCYKK